MSRLLPSNLTHHSGPLRPLVYPSTGAGAVVLGLAAFPTLAAVALGVTAVVLRAAL